jgi:polyphenol oxidase
MTFIPLATMPSRRSIIKGAAGLAGVATIGTVAPLSVYGESAVNTAVRQDVIEFAKDAARLAKFEAAIKEMQDRSKANPNDPKGWFVNARAHADFRAAAGTDPKQVHFCWWFLTWHRAYIVVTERKIREITGDQTLCYPYWNWSTDRRIPSAYSRLGSPLANAVRFTPNRPVDDGEVDYVPDDPVLKKLGVAALEVKFFEAQTPSQIRRSFGGIARPNSTNTFGNNRLEGTPHGPIHNYVGGENDQGQVGDMADFETAARDPIFFAHHGNLDRLWEIWRKDPARKSTEPTSDAFLKHKFVFTWLDGTSMEIAVSDTLDTRKVEYSYDYLEVFRPGAPIAIVAQAAESRPAPIASDKIRVPLSPQGADENERKILEITDVERPDQPMTVGVYLKPANAPGDQLGINVGSFAAVRSGGEIAWPSRTLSFDITAAANRFAGQELSVELIPYRIRAQGAESYPQLKYGQMRIVTEK